MDLGWTRISLPLLLDGSGVFCVWIAWTLCHVNRRCGRNRLRAQAPPTLSHNVTHVVLFDSSTHWGSLYRPRALTEVTILTLAMLNQLIFVSKAKSGLWPVSVKQRQLCLFGCWASVASVFSSYFPHFGIKYDVSLNHLSSWCFLSCVRYHWVVSRTTTDASHQNASGVVSLETQHVTYLNPMTWGPGLTGEVVTWAFCTLLPGWSASDSMLTIVNTVDGKMAFLSLSVREADPDGSQNRIACSSYQVLSTCQVS